MEATAREAVPFAVPTSGGVVRLFARVAGPISGSFARLSDLGVDKASPTHTRVIQGANHFYLLSALANAPIVVIIAIGSWPDTLAPAIMHAAVIAGWLIAVFFNGRGHTTVATLLGIGLPLLQYAYLAAVFSDAALFQLQMLLLGGLVYVVFVPSRWRWGLLGSFAGVAAAAIVVALPAFAEPRFDVSDAWISVAAVYNMTVSALFVFLIGFFNNGYLRRERRRNAVLLEEARQLAITDALTGLYNRRGIESELQAAQLSGDFALAIIDVDRFKQVNDRLGHQVGDEVLSDVARNLTEALPREAAIARWGGEEFLVLMPSMSLPDALLHLENARASVDRSITVDGETQHVTVSAGVVRVDDPVVSDIALARADAQLYEAKREGRNTVRGVTLRVRATRRAPEEAMGHGAAEE